MYQWAPPGGSESGARGVRPTSRRSESSASSSGNRSNSSVPRPCRRTRAPSGASAAGRNRCGQDSRPALIPGPWSRPEADAWLAAEARGLGRVAAVVPEPVVSPRAIPPDVGGLVVEREVVGDRVVGGIGAAERLARDHDDAAREWRRLARLVVADRVVADDGAPRADEPDAGAGGG